jgi:DNA-binding NarL/FixJ family response regulator
MTVVGAASNSAEACQRARVLRLDVILAGIGLGDESGFDLAGLAASRNSGSLANRGRRWVFAVVAGGQPHETLGLPGVITE